MANIVQLVDVYLKLNCKLMTNPIFFDSPVGPITIIASNRGLLALCFQEDHKLSYTVKQYSLPQAITKDYLKVIKQTKDWLHHYFAKQFDRLQLPKIDLQGTPFSIAAWTKLLEVKLGETLSYGQLATKMDAPHSARAIGRVIGKNPIPILIPCHRVIGSNGTLTGYSAGIDRKIWLLEHEGLSIC